MAEVHRFDVIYPWTDAWGVPEGADRRPSVRVMCIFMRRECSLFYDTVAKCYKWALWFEWANSEVGLHAFLHLLGTFVISFKYSSSLRSYLS